jgi:Flp pilus assembly protein TadG
MNRLKEDSGQVLVMTALSITVLLGFIAFATDVGLLLRERRMVQTAADSSAIAGAAESLYEGTPNYVTSGMWRAASGDSAFNGFTAGASNGTRNGSTGTTLKLNVYPNITIPGFNSAGYVQAVVTQTTPTFFMNMFGFHNMDVTVTAIASNSLQSDGCIYVQDGGNYAYDDTVDMNGHSIIAAPSCGMTVNGSIDLQDKGTTIDAKFVTASGTINPPQPGWSKAPAPPDPLPDLQLDQNKPTPNGSGGCNPPTNSSGMTCVYNYDVNAGKKGSTCCTLSGNLTSNAVYYYDKPVMVTGNVTGSNVEIYLTGNTNYLDFASVGTLTLSPAPCPSDTNPYCGVVIDAPLVGSNGAGTYTCSSGKGNNATNPGEIYFDFGSSTTTLNGIVYAPYMQLFVQDQGASTNLNTDLIIGNICAQSGNLNVNGYSAGNSPITRVGLVY